MLQVAMAILKNFTSPGRSIHCKWIWAIFENYSKSPEHQILQVAIQTSCTPFVVSGYFQMQGFAKTSPYRHTLHSLQVLVIYYYRGKKQRLRIFALCLYVGHTRGLVSSSTTLLSFTARTSAFPSGGLMPCPNRTFANLYGQNICRHLHTDICQMSFGHLPILNLKRKINHGNAIKVKMHN